MASDRTKYTYDNAGRRATMTVAGQSAVTYTLDNANRLTQIAQGSDAIGFAYDNANRRTGTTLANGVVMTYGYFSYNPNGGGPDGHASPNSNSIGGALAIGAGLGPGIGMGVNYGGTLGCDGRWSEYGGPTPEWGFAKGDGFHIKLEGKAVLQITHNF